MVKLTFKNGAIDWRDTYGTPQAFARAMWGLAIEELEFWTERGFAVGCEVAPVDRETYDALFEWAKAQNDLNDYQKARLFDALVRKRPKPTNTELRNKRLRLTAQVLVDHFGLNLTRNKANVGVECAASILAELPGTPTEDTIANVLLSTKKAHR